MALRLYISQLGILTSFWECGTVIIERNGLKAKIITTGSSGVALRKKGELLPGRGLEGNEYYLKPISFREFVFQTLDYIKSHSETKEFQNALERLKDALAKVSINMELDIHELYNVVNTVIPFKKGDLLA